MKIKNAFKLLIIFLVLLLNFSSGIFAKTTLNCGYTYEATHFVHRGAEIFADLVQKRTGGELEILLYPGSQLGTEEAVLEQTIHGATEMTICGAGQIANIFKPMGVLEMPYIFKDYDHVVRFGKSEIAQQMYSDLMKEQGLISLAPMPYGARHITSKKPIYTPADLDGFKMRVPEQETAIAYAKAMGANPTPISGAEMYLALQQGVADGLENPIPTINAYKLWEVQSYVNLSGHITTCLFFLINGNTFNNLSQENQKIVQESALEAVEWIANTLNIEDKELLEVLKANGMTIIQPDVEAFKEKTKGMPIEYRSWWSRYGEDLYSVIQNL